MIQVKTENYGLIDISQENALELTTQAMCGDGTPVDEGWYCTSIDNDQLKSYQHFYIISDKQMSSLLDNPEGYMAVCDSGGKMNSWILYHIKDANFMSVAMPTTHYLYAFTEDTSLVQFKLMF